MGLKIEGRSLARRSQGVTVAPSRFNAVKLELILIIAGAVVVWLAVGNSAQSDWGQLAWLGGYGLTALAWVVFRARRILRLHPGEETHGA